MAAVAERLGTERRLVLLVGANSVDAVVIYLAALATGNPVLLVPGDNSATLESLAAVYDPDVVVRPVDGHWLIDQRRTVSAHELHPDLALLLSTSGSTGSPKLVRLSHQNLQANAESIAGYLGIRGSDRAATSLPMHYCYGLSVINSHLLRGAGLILTDLSVADARFWELFRRGRGTTFAGVPYTFDLLDRVGFASLRLPHLRYVTQAGGRLAPDRVRQYAELGRRNGWDLFVMYGQTEATARMAYLPPDLAAAHPQTIGIPIPGGSFRLEAVADRADQDAGELVYAGPNVMLGYARSASDLGLGRTVDDLHTGDIARRTGEGLYELVGRRSRFVKVFGLRIDLQHIEAMLPRLPTGKPDPLAVRNLTRGTTPAPAARGCASPPDAEASDLRKLFAEVLDRSDVTDDSSFVSLGGDSLSYVELSVRLEHALRHLPADWHTHADPGPAPGQAVRRQSSTNAQGKVCRNQRGPARDRDRAHRRHARRTVQRPRRRPSAAGRRRIQLRPLPSDIRRTPGTCPAAVCEHRPHRGRKHGLDRPGIPVDRRLPLQQRLPPQHRSRAPRMARTRFLVRRKPSSTSCWCWPPWWPSPTSTAWSGGLRSVFRWSS